MKVMSNKRADSLYIYLSGELDEYASSSLRRKVDTILEDNVNCQKVIFNLTGLSFMDSTGIGFLLGRYKKLQHLNIDAHIECASASIDKLITISGLYSVMKKV